MPVAFECPHCKTKYEVADDMAGKSLLCRACQKRAAVSPSGAARPPAVSGPVVAAATAAKAAESAATRRTVLLALAYGLPVGLLGFAGVYYWSRPFPWEVKTPDSGREGWGPPGRRRGPPEGEGPPKEGEPKPGEPKPGEPKQGEGK